MIRTKKRFLELITMRNLNFNVYIWLIIVLISLGMSVNCFKRDLNLISYHSGVAQEMGINDKKGHEQESRPNIFKQVSYGTVFDGTRTKRASEKRQRKRRKGPRNKKKASIHMIPKMQDLPISGSFDKQGNINSDWEAQSCNNMRFIIDSRPRNESADICNNEVYIVIKHTGIYFIYGQIFFHGQNHEMGHCLHIADSYRPCNCSEDTCKDRKVMCSRSAPGHPRTYKIIRNISTNYIGGVVFLKKGSTIRLAVDANESINMEKSIEIDKSMCYFGAFAV